ncbi:MAG TPA: pseudouridine-5'-phosphate glycosidase [Blastocatellia bacterium]|nr:pseudouridine-5'-phosphate glycosidase [Blastocatellia bacterium]
MKIDQKNILRLALRVAKAIDARQPVVALESTVIAHGLPRPLNLESAHACQQAVFEHGAVPATVAVIDGRAVVGLSETEINSFAEGAAPDGARIEKVSLNNLAAVIARRGWGATTVAATLRVAHLAGLRVFSTGGIGGVHRGAADTFDLSADLTALATTPVVCVSAGAKAILDLPKTIEQLETLGVPVVGYRTDEFPAFYSRRSGLGLDIVVESAEEAARLAMLHWATGARTAVLVCAPVPEEFEMSRDEVDRALEEALRACARAEVRGKATTPFLLSQMERATGGKTLGANRALLVNNAAIAAQIARSLSAMA